jgi:hypothetical protein
MPYDPTIALRAVQPQIDFGGAVQNAMAFRNAQQVNQLNQLKLAQEQQAMQQETGLRNYLAQSPDLSAPETQRQLIGQYGAAGIDVVNKELQRRKFQEEVDKAGRENVTEALGNARDMYAGVLARHADNLNSEEALKDYLEVTRTAHNNEFLGPALKTTGASLANTYTKAQTALENGTLGDLIQSSAMSADQIRESIKAKAEAAAPKTELGKLRAERQRALDAGDTEAVKLYDTASRIEAGQDVSAKDKANLNLDWAKYYWSQKQNSPEYKAQVAAAEAEGKDKVTFNAKLPSVISNATQAINLIDTMIGTPEVKDKEGKVVQKATAAHPGISAVGSIFNPLTTRISGTDAANFKAYLDQVQGGAFLDAYNTLRGGGAITQVEGQKATAAVTRMNLAQSKDEFIKAAREYQEVLRKGIENAKNKSGATATSIGGDSSSIQSLLDKYK